MSKRCFEETISDGELNRVVWNRLSLSQEPRLRDVEPERTNSPRHRDSGVLMLGGVPQSTGSKKPKRRTPRPIKTRPRFRRFPQWWLYPPLR